MDVEIKQDSELDQSLGTVQKPSLEKPFKFIRRLISFKISSNVSEYVPTHWDNERYILYRDIKCFDNT